MLRTQNTAGHIVRSIYVVIIVIGGKSESTGTNENTLVDLVVRKCACSLLMAPLFFFFFFREIRSKVIS